MRATWLAALGAFAIAGGCARESGKAGGGAGSATAATGPGSTAGSAAAPAPAKRTSLITVGEVAPDFEVVGHDGTTVTLSKLAGKPVVLYFYPKDDTPG